MTPVVDYTNPTSVLVATTLFVLFLWLARETKRSYLVFLLLGFFLTIMSCHAVEFLFASGANIVGIARCITFDFVIVALTFFTYLWLDDIEARERKIKSVNNCLDWLWNTKA